jgi:hypothetical protein
MAEVYDGEVRVAATCAVCKKVWKPQVSTEIKWEWRYAVVKTDPIFHIES